MGRYSRDVQRFIIGELAAFCTPSDVAERVKDKFGVEISRQAVECYNPQRAAGRGLSASLRELFDAARAEYIEQLAAVPLAHRRYRLDCLQRVLDRAEREADTPSVLRALEVAAREMAAVERAGEPMGELPEIRVTRWIVDSDGSSHQLCA